MTAPGADLPAQGRFCGAEHRLPVRVYFEDTDLSGVVYHANYLRFMERARSEMLRLAGVDHGGWMAGGGGAYAVTDVQIRYRAPARLDDVLLVVSRLERIRAAGIVVHQEVRRDAAVLADARVSVALVSSAGRPARQPAHWIALYENLLNQGAATPS